MRYKIKDIGDEGLDLRVSVTPAWMEASCPGLRLTEEGITLAGRLEMSGSDYLLRGELRGSVTMLCARCLEDARVPLEIPLAVSYVERDEEEDDPGEAIAGGAEDGGDVLSFSGGEIDLSDEIRDEVLLALPIGPLCRPDCAGICSVCGGNRNEAPCDCEERQRMAASKLSALKDLKV